jgi:eukaryotic-like serine/threonine-protein kinase
MTKPRLVGSRYELGELIGYGGMAEVHRGRDLRLSRDVAIKILRADLARDSSFLNRFRREAQSAAGLNHPSIVAVYDTGEDVAHDGTVMPYIVMEFVEGRTLREIIKAEGPLPPRRAMEITAEVAGALDFSHRNGLIHRDVKPANVMITRDGAVKVMDFGIARALADNSVTVTATAAVIGTAQYLSPEQARGEPVDARSDVYSTGCMLYELLTGQPPFQGDSPVAVAYQHVRENAPEPSSLNPAIPPALDSIVMKALAKNPLNRYQSAAEMREDLLRALADRPVQAESVLTDAERTQYIARSNAVPPVQRPVAGLDDYDDDHQGRSGLIWAAVVVILLIVIGVAAYAIVRTSSQTTKMVAVPSIVGQTQDAAVNSLRAAGLNPGNITSASTGCASQNPTVGTVCTQQFAGGSMQAKGTSVDFTTYVVGTAEVPPCQEGTFADCQALLGKLGLKVAPDPQDNAAAANTVISTDPVAYTKLALGTTVKVTYSTGKIAVPSEVGKTQSAAQGDLNTKGFSNFKIAIVAVTAAGQNGIVQTQNPGSGSFPTSQLITLTIGQYTAPPPSPSVSSSASTRPAASCTPNTPTPVGVPPTTPPPTC